MTSHENSIDPNQMITQEIHDQFENIDAKQTITNFSQSELPKNTSFKKNHLNFDEDELEKKVNEFLQSKIQLSQIQTDENHDEFCVCTDCTYERNLNKPSHTLFNLTMRSMYKQQFQDNFNKNDELKTTKKLEKELQEKFNSKDINEKESSIHPKNKITFETIYNIEMSKSSNQERRKSLKNDDELKFNGPLLSISTYRERFPGISGGNPYVKPVDKAFRENFSLNAKTMNQTLYKGQFTSRSNLAKSPDNLKTGLPMLFKESTSQKFYSKPSNPEDYNTSRKTLTKHEDRRTESVHDKQQFNSTYRQSFNGEKMLELAKQKKRLIRDTWTKLGMIGY